MSKKSEHLCKRLRQAGEKSQAFFDELTPEQWTQQVYTEGASWTISQIMAHFVMAEDGMMRLVARIVETGEGVPEDFDIDSYNEYKASKLESDSPDELMKKFLEARENTIQMVSQFDEADLEKTGRHPWLGMAQVEEIIKLMYRHNQIHQREIRAALQR
ncbi:MAG: DinB family protein [Anaerolineales bacterium]|nr:DinB family protein [Anaerolineales bacterium]